MCCPSPFENKLFWKHELNKINSGVSKERKTLHHFLEMEKPYFLTKEELKQYIPLNELEVFANKFHSNPEIKFKIHLPFVFIQQGNYYRTSGSKYDIWAVERLFEHEKTNHIISIKDYSPKHTYYYSYQINKLRRQFPTLVQVVYSI